MIGIGSAGESSPGYTSKMIIFALGIMFLFPIMFTLYVPAVAEAGEYDEQIKDLENEYYLSTGSQVSATTEVWALSGIYTPFDGKQYGTTADGWIYSDKVVNYSPEQYNVGTSAISVRLMDNGLYYYTSVPSTDLSHTAATYTAGTDTWDYSEASLYTSVTMDSAHTSSVFFTTSSKTTTDDGYYYDYTGYRYAFSPLRAYETEVGGQVVEVQPNSTSLSLIWYQYSSYNGIAGQLAISGSDTGVSYLTSAEIVKAFNSSTYSSTFDMTFNNVKMHLTIKLDAVKLAAGMTVQEAYNSGFWSVVVSSDAVASSSINNSTYDFSADNIWNTLVDLFTFNLTDDYDIEGWEATLASIMVSMPLYACLIALALSNYWILIGVALLAAINSASSWWPW